MIKVSNFTISFDETTILKDINVEIPQNTFTVILGHSGSGKSVLSKSIIGLFRDFSGVISFAGKAIDYGSTKELFKLRKSVGMLFQSGALFDSMNVYQNIAFPFFEHTKLKEEEIKLKVASLLEEVGLPGIEEKFPSELSGGMKRRVAFARAIALKPSFLIYDEPTTGLDPKTTKGIISLIKSLHGSAISSTCVITHDFASFEPLCEHIIILDEGVCLYSGRVTKELLERADIKPLLNK